MGFVSPPRKSRGFGRRTSAKKQKKVRKEMQTGISTRNQIKIGDVNVSGSSPISNMSLLELNQNINKFRRNGEQRSGIRNHPVTRKILMPTYPLRGVTGKGNTTSIKKLRTKSVEKKNRLRKRNGPKGVRRTPIKGKVKQ